MSTLQNAKDCFYLALRDRLAVLNPDRTVVLRGATRPAIVVAENELAVADMVLPNCFLLHWAELAVDTSEAMPLLHARCSIHYGTEGSPEVAGMDRGRMLAAMDAELAAVLRPSVAPQHNFDGIRTGPLLTNVFWSEPVFAAAAPTANRVERSATVDVFAWKEPA